MSAGRARCKRRHGRIDPVAPDEDLRDRGIRRRAQHHQPAPRPNRRLQIVGRWRAQQPDRTCGWFLDCLEQGVGSVLGQPVGVLDQDGCQRFPAGDNAARRTSSRVSATPYESPLGRTTSTSACVPIRTVWQAEHVPQPPFGHCSAAAIARAAVDRPDPGGPVKSQACVIAAPGCADSVIGSPPKIASAAATARRSSATTRSCPTRSSKTSGAVARATSWSSHGSMRGAAACAPRPGRRQARRDGVPPALIDAHRRGCRRSRRPDRHPGSVQADQFDRRSCRHRGSGRLPRVRLAVGCGCRTACRDASASAMRSWLSSSSWRRCSVSSCARRRCSSSSVNAWVSACWRSSSARRWLAGELDLAALLPPARARSSRALRASLLDLLPVCRADSGTRSWSRCRIRTASRLLDRQRCVDDDVSRPDSLGESQKLGANAVMELRRLGLELIELGASAGETISGGTSRSTERPLQATRGPLRQVGDVVSGQCSASALMRQLDESLSDP